jgi:hypothetical protein
MLAPPQSPSRKRSRFGGLRSHDPRGTQENPPGRSCLSGGLSCVWLAASDHGRSHPFPCRIPAVPSGCRGVGHAQPLAPIRGRSAKQRAGAGPVARREGSPRPPDALYRGGGYRRDRARELAQAEYVHIEQGCCVVRRSLDSTNMLPAEAAVKAVRLVVVMDDGE